MSLLFNKFQLLHAPEDNPVGSGSMDILSELMKDDETPEVIDLDDKKPEVKDKEEDKEEKDDDDKGKEKEKEEDDEEDNDDEEEKEVDELEELEKELEGPDEKQLELMTPARRKDILTKYPKLFKDFPYLETAYYRDQKFTEVFPTIKEAEEASTTVKSFNDLQAKLKTGDIESVVTDIAKDQKAFYKLVDNYLPTLSKVSPDAYHHIVGNLMKYTIREMVGEATNSQNEELRKAATTLHTFIFGNTKWTPPTNLSGNDKPEDNKAESDLQQREREFAERKFNNAQGEIASRVDNAIKATIDQHIDPNKQMTSFVKDAAVEKAMRNVEKLISADTRFRTLLDRLWQNAADKDFAKSEMEKIKSACISKARTLLPTVIKSARQEALKGLHRTRQEKEDEKNTDTTSSKDTPRSRRSADKGSISKDKYAGMSTMEAMMADD